MFETHALASISFFTNPCTIISSCCFELFVVCSIPIPPGLSKSTFLGDLKATPTRMVKSKSNQARRARHEKYQEAVRLDLPASVA